MNRKSNLIIPDADVVIHLFELDIWVKFLALNQVFLAQTVVDDEVSFYRTGPYDLKSKEYIDLSEDVSTGRLTVVSLDAKDIQPMLTELERMHAPLIDPGETETIAASYLNYPDDLQVCLVDAAAIKCAVMLDLRHKCVSVERALTNCGLGRQLPKELSDKRFHEIVKQAELQKVYCFNRNGQ